LLTSNCGLLQCFPTWFFLATVFPHMFFYRFFSKIIFIEFIFLILSWLEI
jgi:hypothetical protein